MEIFKHKYKLIFFLILISSIKISSVYAYDCIVDTNADGIGDGTAGAFSEHSTALACGVSAEATGSGTGTGSGTTSVGSYSQASESLSTALGSSSTARRHNSTALGSGSLASEMYSTAVGTSSWARGFNSTAVGYGARATGSNSITLGGSSSTTGALSTALGYASRAQSRGSVSLGQKAGFNNNSSVTDSPQAIAIGSFANIKPASTGAIAIGGDMDGDNKGAEASAPGAIAIGADVVADKANTMAVNVPIHIKRWDGTSQLRITETSGSDNVRTLLNLICNNCTPGFRFKKLFPNNQTWFFRMLQNGDFSMDDPLTVAKEAQFKSGGDLVIGGTLTQASSREIKTNFTELNGAEILNKLDELPITRWSYKKDDGKINHIGPMSEDFYSLFNVGLNSKGLSSVDTAGVALAAVKALKQENDELKVQDNALAQLVQEKDTQIAQLQYQIDDLKNILQSIVVQNQYE